MINFKLNAFYSLNIVLIFFYLVIIFSFGFIYFFIYK